MDDPEFDLNALYLALEEQRVARDLTWAAVTREVNRFRTAGHLIASSTIRGLKTQRTGEGDGILQMLIWLDRSPESFVSDQNGIMKDAPLPKVSEDRILRWDASAIHAALDDARQSRDMTWAKLAAEIGGHNADGLKRLKEGGRVGFPRVMRILRWLEMPAANLTRVSEW